jgi:hypothetical protein
MKSVGTGKPDGTGPEASRERKITLPPADGTLASELAPELPPEPPLAEADEAASLPLQATRPASATKLAAEMHRIEPRL